MRKREALSSKPSSFSIQEESFRSVSSILWEGKKRGDFTQRFSPIGEILLLHNDRKNYSFQKVEAIDFDDAETGEWYNSLSGIDPNSSEWLGRRIEKRDAQDLYLSIYSRLKAALALEDLDSPYAILAIVYFARQGALDPSLLQKDIVELLDSPEGLLLRGKDGVILPVGFGKSVKKFWKKHKTEILIGLAVTAIVATIVVVTIATAGTGSAPAAAAGKGGAAGMAGALSLSESPSTSTPSSKETPQEPKNTQTSPPEDALLLNGVYYSKEGVHSQGQTYSYFEWAQHLEQEQQLWQLLYPEEYAACVDIVQTWHDQRIHPEPSLPEDPLVIPEGLPQSRSVYFPEARLETPSVGGINGMSNSPQTAKSNRTYLATISGHDVNWTYNATHGGWDLLECAINFAGYSPNTSQDLRNTWESFAKENAHNPHAKYLQYCHSQGTIHVRNTLEACPQEIRDRIIVVAIAPATIVPKNLCYDSYNYASARDPVPYLESIFFGFFDPNETENSQRLQKILQQRGELLLLTPHPEAPMFDHDFQSPTYKNVIEDHARTHIENGGNYP